MQVEEVHFNHDPNSATMDWSLNNATEWLEVGMLVASVSAAT
ncbi:MAG TPA: hypothetical protein VFK05_07320 [Polyangiaceae bacterium]|nr:hypothetical protein [Polyangiaceae bacterium]